MLQRELRGWLLPHYLALAPRSFDEIRTSFVYRNTRDERREVIALTDPNENIAGLQLTADPTQKNPQLTGDSLRSVWRDIPWSLWLAPLLRWGSLFLVIFLLIMCLAEWLRRKWIDRENLAFPLVDVADHIIRPDAELEKTNDPALATRRRIPMDPLFLGGLLLAALIVSLDAMRHYGFTGGFALSLDVSSLLFTEGELKRFDRLFLVLSPIIIGLAFLISLELSFSIWVLFALWTIALWLLEGAVEGGIRDDLYTGWAGGRDFPFTMEQTLGAAACFALILVYKMFRSRSTTTATSTATAAQGQLADDDLGSFIPKGAALAGAVLLPLIALALLWSYGLSGGGGLFLLAIISPLLFALVIATARARAETGLPTHHASYQFVKLPMILGLTGLTGATVFGIYALLAFLPLTLLFATLPQHLENIELARRHRLAYAWVASGAVLAFLVAVGGGMLWFLSFSYLYGDFFFAGNEAVTPGPHSFTIARYPLWITHFLGEASLGEFREIHWVRVYALLGGFGFFAALVALRSRFLRFPLHPLGYLIVLLSISYPWVDLYPRGQIADAPNASKEASWLWASVFLAWLVKWLTIKFGGMNVYRRMKPAFIGFVVGAVFTIFLWDMADGYADLAAWLQGGDAAAESPLVPSQFLEEDVPLYSPAYY